MQYSYYDPVRNWRRIEQHLSAVEPVLVHDFNRFTWGTWRRKFEAGMYPDQFESCDWRIDRRGRWPRYWKYVKHAACHWLVNHNLELAQAVQPDFEWRILTSVRHSTVYNGHGMLFDLNFCALQISPRDAYRLARNGGRGKILKPGQHLIVHYAEHWRREKERHD